MFLSNMKWTSYTREHIRILIWILFFINTHSVYGQVAIVSTYPFYAVAGEELVIFCRTDMRYDLEWARATPSSSYQEETIEAVRGGRFRIRKVSEEPSGYRESTLTIANATLNDRSTYWCRARSESHSFMVYITVLEVGGSASVASESLGNSMFQCDLVGFDTNPPDVQYVWYYNGSQIPLHGQHKYVERALEIIGAASTTLEVKDTVYEDTGEYTCTFMLGTDGEPFLVSKTFFLDARHLDKEVIIDSGCRQQYPFFLAITLPMIAFIFCGYH